MMDGLCLQHLKDLISHSASEGVLLLLSAVTSLVSEIVRVDTPTSILTHGIGDSFVALHKKERHLPYCCRVYLENTGSKVCLFHALSIVRDILVPRQ